MFDVDVCICTFRRETVHDTLYSLAKQKLPLGMTFRVIVADNDDAPSARVRVTAVGDALSVHYVHAPARNISLARNACLDAATAPILAFIDDDEVASPDWLAQLLFVMDQSQAPVILGPVQASYDEKLPSWVRKADLHSTYPAIRQDGSIDTGYSCNVLFQKHILDGLRFDLALGRTGGEDDQFFSTLNRRGHRIAFASEGVVVEAVGGLRGTLRWLLRRSFRNGQTYAAIRLASGDHRAVLFLKAGAKASVYGLAMIGQFWSDWRWRKAMVRGTLHVGVMAKLLGKRDLELY